MVGEAGYDFVRRGIVYETLGKREGEKYVPLMVSLFFFIWIMNIWSVIPLAQFPVSSVFAFPVYSPRWSGSSGSRSRSSATASSASSRT